MSDAAIAASLLVSEWAPSPCAFRSVVTTDDAASDALPPLSIVAFVSTTAAVDEAGSVIDGPCSTMCQLVGLAGVSVDVALRLMFPARMVADVIVTSAALLAAMTPELSVPVCVFSAEKLRLPLAPLVR